MILSPQAVERLLERVRSDTPEGFQRFYEVVHNTTVPPHALEWVVAAYAAREHKKGVLIEAFAGSTKTTTLTTMYAYQIGLYPQKANLHLAPNDDAVTDTIAKVADIIQNNAGFKLCFPAVVPDASQGFSASGYEVRVTEDVMPYAEWRRLNSARRDPSLLGVTYTSRDLPGRHPDGMMGMDDLDNEENTTSIREKKRLRVILQGTVFSRIVPSQTWIWYIGTPWDSDDTIHYLATTGRFEHLRTPVRESGKEDGAPIWPEKFGPEAIKEQLELMGSAQFARFMLLNLDLLKGTVLKLEWLRRYPVESIHPSWPAFLGIDYASTADKAKSKDSDFFACAIGRRTPDNQVVLVDGIRERLTRGEAEAKVVALAASLPSLQLVGVETDGIGKEFYGQLLQNTRLPIWPSPTHGKSKGARFETWMAPLFEFSRAWVSTATTPFLKTFEDEWVSWDGSQRAHDDTLDGVYHMLRVATGEQGVRNPAMNEEPWYARTKKPNPYAALGRR